ncbi:hypothetical protein MIDIC_70005 [Alphaproteobacteria bacterium]
MNPRIINWYPIHFFTNKYVKEHTSQIAPIFTAVTGNVNSKTITKIDNINNSQIDRLMCVLAS